MDFEDPNRTPVSQSDAAGESPLEGDRPEIRIEIDEDPIYNLRELGHLLVNGGDLFRNSGHGGGLLRILDGRPVAVTTAGQLSPIVVERLIAYVTKGSDLKARQIPDKFLKLALSSDAFLKNFRAVDVVTKLPGYGHDFQLLRPVFNAGPPGWNIFLDGPAIEPSFDMTPLADFLDVMNFRSPADRTNAVAAALIMLLRQYWPGAKPVIVVMANKQQAGKDTILDFIHGAEEVIELSLQVNKDWPNEKNMANLAASRPQAGVFAFRNIRLDGNARFISSMYLERFTTTPYPTLHNTGSGGEHPVRNSFVVLIP